MMSSFRMLHSATRHRALRSLTTKPTVSLQPLRSSAAVFGAANALGFGVSIATGWHYHLDLIGTGAFTIAALATAGNHPRQSLSAVSVSLWSTKLAGFLFYRALQTHRDERRPIMKSNIRPR